MSQQTQDRRWEINLELDGDGYPDLQGFEERLAQEHLALAAIEHRLGGASQSYVIRQQDPESGLWFPVKAVFKWQSFVPGIRAPRPKPAPPEEPVELAEEPDLSDVIGGLEPDAGPEFSPPRESVDAEEGQLFEKDGDMQVAESMDDQQALLADGWKPVGVE